MDVVYLVKQETFTGESVVAVFSSEDRADAYIYENEVWGSPDMWKEVWEVDHYAYPGSAPYDEYDEYDE